MEPMRLRMVSVRSTVGDLGGNTARILDSCRSAASDDVDLVCFPELSVTGYAMPDSRSFASDESVLGPIVDASSELGISVCCGYVDGGGRIAQALIEGGRIVGTYRKTHLGEREADAMVPGDSLPVFKLGKANVAIQICWEAHFPEITGTYALDGADIVLMPFASGLTGERRQSSWDRVLPARAYDNTVFVAACNAWGDNGRGTVLGGGAAVYDVRGSKMASAEGECEVTVDLDPSQMDRIRAEGYESMRDVYFLDKRRPELYGRLVR
ncbi:MAG: nitrilase-related carbon-nitrogen hydrolase [Thermoplasmata archaeon]|nr:nitrilase-related carbon-nitrogen hydrolase [Thermoplasmata archaeon]